MGIVRPSARKLLHHSQAVHLGQAQVDDGQVERILARLEQAFLAIGGLVHPVAVGFELPGQAKPQYGVVFDQQQAHEGMEPSAA